MIRSTAVALMLLTGLPMAGAMALRGGEPPAGAATFAWPESKAGKAAEAFFAMIAAGTDEAVREFETAFRGREALASTPMDQRIARMKDLRGELGILMPTQVISESGGSLKLAAVDSKGNEVDLEFEMDAVDPARIAKIMIGVGGPAHAGPAVELGETQRAEIVESVAGALTRGYVFPEVARAMAEKIRSELEMGAYSELRDERAFAARLTEDLRSISHDKHLGVRFAPVTPDAGEHSFVPQGVEAAKDNYAFKKVEILPGNIGYVRLDLFLEDAEAMKTADAAMAFLKNADALVFDLRYNGGGSPEMIRHLTSYLFSSPTHLNSMLDRNGEVVDEYWTGDVPGTPFRDDVPVYVLTSSYTFSGGEEFSYNLKALKRATVVGETTGGGAHPVRGVRISDRFVVGVPFLRAQNPITGTNWEGVGVEPDVKTSADAALDMAIDLARAALAGT